MLSVTLKNAPQKSTTVKCVASGGFVLTEYVGPAHQLENQPLLHLPLLNHVSGDKNHLASSQVIWDVLL